MDRAEDIETPFPNGVPEAVAFETTGQLEAALKSVVAGETDVSPEDFLQQLASKVVECGGGPGSGDGGEAQQKTAKKQGWIAILIMLIVGPGGVIGAHYALKGQAEANTREVEVLKKASKALEPRVEKSEDQIRLIKVDVSGINKSMGTMKTQQTTIVEGIGELKAENLKDLEEELDDAKREIRRLRHDR